MRSYRRSPDRGNKLTVSKGLGVQSAGAAGPVRHIDPNTVAISVPAPIDPKYLAYRKWCRQNQTDPKSPEQWRLSRSRNKKR